MSDTIKLVVDAYKTYVDELRSEAEKGIPLQHGESVVITMPSWVKYINGLKELGDAVSRYSRMVVTSAQDFEACADNLIEADQYVAQTLSGGR